MSEMQITGIVKMVSDEQQVTPSFTKRELVVTTEEQYPQHILINFTQGKCNSDLDQLKVGTRVSVSINIRGREWINPQGEAKYFNDIQGWKLALIANYGENNPAPTKQQPAQKQPAPANTNLPKPAESENLWGEEAEDDLPF